MHETREKRRRNLETYAEGGQASSVGAGRTSFTRRQIAPVEMCGVACNKQQWVLPLPLTLCRKRSLEKASWRLGPALGSRQPGRSWALVNRSCERQATRPETLAASRGSIDMSKDLLRRLCIGWESYLRTYMHTYYIHILRTSFFFNIVLAARDSALALLHPHKHTYIRIRTSLQPPQLAGKKAYTYTTYTLTYVVYNVYMCMYMNGCTRPCM